MREPFIVLDFETTGMAPNSGARATEIGAVLVQDGRIKAQFQSLMNAGVRIPFFIQELTGITNAMIAKAPPCNEVMRQFHDFIGDTPLVAHNAAFDRKFLDAELSLIGLQARQPMICSMRIARRVFQDAPNHKLGTLVRYAHIEADGVFHRALADAEKTAKLMLKMASHLHESHGLHTVNLELMQRLESTAKAQVANQLRCWNS
jgi:DNA polymerase-3 subunit epsilon